APPVRGGEQSEVWHRGNRDEVLGRVEGTQVERGGRATVGGVGEPGTGHGGVDQADGPSDGRGAGAFRTVRRAPDDAAGPDAVRSLQAGAVVGTGVPLHRL